MKNSPLVVLSLLVLMFCGAIYSRQSVLADRLDALERREPAPSRALAAPASAPGEGDRALTSPSAAAPTAIASAPAPCPAPAALPAAFSTEQREAIAKEVERQLQARAPSLSAFTREEPLAVMEKELGLNPAQIVRVAELLKRRDEERSRLSESGGFQGAPEEFPKRSMELEEKYDEAVRGELDFGQRQKYARLKEEGRLNGGIVFRVQLSAEQK